MTKAKISLAYKLIIDKNSTDVFGIGVFNESYLEFIFQAEAFNPDNIFSTFEEIVENNPGAHIIHDQLGLKIKRYINSLNNVIPELQDTLGFGGIHFVNYQLNLLNSHISNKDIHKVAIIFYSSPLILLETIGDYMILAEENHFSSKKQMETFVLKMQPMLSVCSFEDYEINAPSMPSGKTTDFKELNVPH